MKKDKYDTSWKYQNKMNIDLKLFLFVRKIYRKIRPKIKPYFLFEFTS